MLYLLPAWLGPVTSHPIIKTHPNRSSLTLIVYGTPHVPFKYKRRMRSAGFRDVIYGKVTCLYNVIVVLVVVLLLVLFPVFFVFVLVLRVYLFVVVVLFFSFFSTFSPLYPSPPNCSCCNADLLSVKLEAFTCYII